MPMQAIIKGWVMTGQMPDLAEATARDPGLRPSFDLRGPSNLCLVVVRDFGATGGTGGEQNNA